MALETFFGDLRTYSELEPGTFLHADQLNADQVQNPILLRIPFHVADGPIYSLEGEKRTPTLFLTREPNNLVLRHLNDKVDSSFDQFNTPDNFRLNAEETRKVMEAEDTLRIDLTKLRLKGDAPQWHYVEISTTDYNLLNSEERKLAERFYGQGNDFVAAMKTLKRWAIGSTKVYVLSPAYVLKEGVSGPDVRITWRSDIYSHTDFGANLQDVNFRGYLRGVRRANEASRQAPAGRAAPRS